MLYDRPELFKKSCEISFVALSRVRGLTCPILSGGSLRGLDHKTLLIRISKKRAYARCQEIAEICFILFEKQMPMETSTPIDLVSHLATRWKCLPHNLRNARQFSPIRLLLVSCYCDRATLMHAVLCFAARLTDGGSSHRSGKGHRPANTKYEPTIRSQAALMSQVSASFDGILPRRVKRPPVGTETRGWGV